MSKSWEKGSTRRWRKTRALVLARDNYRCRVQLDGCTTIADTAHHVLGRAVSGDDQAHLVAACRHCNLSIGEPTHATDPTPIRRTAW